MTKIAIPPEAMGHDFIAALRASYVAQDPTAKRLAIATNLANELGRSYLDSALSASRAAIHEILVDAIHYQPDEDDEPAPDHRAPAALLFLYGVNAGYWAATADEMDLARAHVITTYGPETLESLPPQKTKTDLAREAGLPTDDYIYQKPQGGRAVKDIMRDYFYVGELAAEADRIAARTPLDLDAAGVALKRYLDALKVYFPSAYEMQTAHLRRTLAPVVAEAYVELLQHHEPPQR